MIDKWMGEKIPQTVVNLVNYELGKLLSERTRLNDQMKASLKTAASYKESLEFNNNKIRELKRFLGEEVEEDGA